MTARTIIIDVTMPELQQTCGGSRSICKALAETWLKMIADEVKRIPATQVFSVPMNTTQTNNKS